MRLAGFLLVLMILTSCGLFKRNRTRVRTSSAVSAVSRADSSAETRERTLNSAQRLEMITDSGTLYAEGENISVAPNGVISGIKKLRQTRTRTENRKKDSLAVSDRSSSVKTGRLDSIGASATADSVGANTSLDTTPVTNLGGRWILAGGIAAGVIALVVGFVFRKRIKKYLRI